MKSSRCGLRVGGGRARECVGWLWWWFLIDRMPPKWEELVAVARGCDWARFLPSPPPPSKPPRRTCPKAPLPTHHLLIRFGRRSTRRVLGEEKGGTLCPTSGSLEVMARNISALWAGQGGWTGLPMWKYLHCRGEPTTSCPLQLPNIRT